MALQGAINHTKGRDNNTQERTTYKQMKTKTNRLNSFSQNTGLKINIKKTKLLKINVANEDTITVEENPVEVVESFTYLGSIVDQKGGTESDVKQWFSNLLFREPQFLS